MDRPACILQSCAEGRIRYDLAFPEVFQQFSTRDNPVAALDQVNQQVEDQWLDRNWFVRKTKLVFFGVQHEVVESVNQPANASKSGLAGAIVILFTSRAAPL